jgi:hypothetical protein
MNGFETKNKRVNNSGTQETTTTTKVKNLKNKDMKKKNIIKTGVLALAIVFSSQAQAQETSTKTKKTQKVHIVKVLPISADKVWGAVAEDFGKIANSHPKIWYSSYEAGSLKGELGAQRRCDFNEKGTKVLHEKITGFDAEKMELYVQILETANFPIDPDYSNGSYKLKAIDATHTEVTFDFEFRTKPAMMGAMAKGKFGGLIEDYMIALEHYLTTGEIVNAKVGNFKEVKKAHKENASKEEKMTSNP